MRETLSMERIVKLAEDGESFTLEAGDCPLQDLVFIAAVIGNTRARVRFRGLDGRSIEDLMRITVASQGRVLLEPGKRQPVSVPQRRSGWFWRRKDAAVQPKRKARAAA